MSRSGDWYGGVAAIVVSLLILAAACGGTGSDQLAIDTSSSVTTSKSEVQTSTTSTTVTSSTTEVEAEAQVPVPADGEVFDAYIADRVEQYYEMVERAFVEPSPSPEFDYPEFEDLAAGRQLEVTYEQIRTSFEDGQADREPAEPAVGTSTDDEHRVSGVKTVNDAEDEVTVFDCEVLDDETYDVETGDTVIHGVLTILTVVTLKEFDGQWKLTFTKVSQKIRGVAGCYLASDAEFPY